MKNYETRKAEARQEAIGWQLRFNEKDHTYYEVAAANERFYKKAKRLGLIKEFKANGII